MTEIVCAQRAGELGPLAAEAGVLDQPAFAWATVSRSLARIGQHGLAGGLDVPARLLGERRAWGSWIREAIETLWAVSPPL